MVRLSVNVNKIATLRNARGGNVPNLLEVVRDIESFGAQGITIHPRPDERHIRYQDARDLKKVVQTELNIEGNPIPEFIDLVLEVLPDQVTLVPDAPDAITSNAGWDTRANRSFLQGVIARFREAGIRTSIFVDPDPDMVRAARDTGTERVELYTEGYARAFPSNPGEAVKPYVKAALAAGEAGLGLNAGHDLSLENISFFRQEVPHLLEVSIGHALICESLYLGLENVINMYKARLR
ncbi:pyridoxine 5'-phosphate synthase [Robiginitalea marina]|uniref:Pyridoxine 5'-phosphate synthase n=1 Tax=Robiginitalea marina TaxID=2954105 RepID=A0ABT1AX99_9FLAO|nr:pyridoxine 5'-phosphate synthase [Robiginitalea marina]MCO5724681.1 pyridoxine 5'-phosphate synthase [Robiginitalea marina]